MASTSEMLFAGIFLIVNTVVIGAFALIGGPIFGALTNFISTFPFAADSPLKPTLIQWIPGFFFMFLVVVEIALIIRLGYVVVSKTDYQGEVEW